MKKWFLLIFIIPNATASLFLIDTSIPYQKPMSNTVFGADMGIFVLYISCKAALLYSVTLW